MFTRIHRRSARYEMDMTTGPLLPKVLAFSGPLILTGILQLLYNAADIVVVGRFAGSQALAAVGSTGALINLLVNVFMGLSVGASVVVARAYGAGDNASVSTGVHTAITVAGVAGVLVGVLGFVASHPLLKWMGSPDDVLDMATLYMKIFFIGMPANMLYNFGAAILRAVGDTRRPLYYLTVSGILNVLLNLVLVIGFHMGVVGAALATLISRVLSAVAVLYFLRQPRQTIVIRDYFKIRPKFSRILNILAVGIPTGIENGMFQFGKLVIQSSVSTLGTTAIAAQAMTSTLELVSSQAPIGLGLGMMTIVGQCMGAGRPEEARQNIKRLCVDSEIVMVICCALIALLVRPITVLGGMEPAAADMAVWMTYIICIVKPLVWMPAFIPAYGMRAAGDVRYSMMVSSCTMWLCRVLTAVVLIRAFHFGPIAVWIGMFFDWSVRAVIFTLRFKSGRWAEKKVLKEAA